MTAANRFEAATAVTPLSSHTYAVNLRLEWCIGTVPHGGYVTSIFHNVAVTHLKHTHPTLHSGAPHPITIHLTFLRRTEAGPATFTVQDTKLGSRTSTLHITLSQLDPDGAVREEAASYITVSNFDQEEGPTMNTGYELSALPVRGPGDLAAVGGVRGGALTVDLARLARDGRDGDWERFHAAFATMRKASQHAEFYTPRRSGMGKTYSGVVEQWARFKPYGRIERWTDASLGYLADMFPMMLETFDRKQWGADGATAPGSAAAAESSSDKVARYWYPTVLLNIEFKKKLPAEGVEWLYSRVQTKVLRDGRMDLDLVMLDEQGEVVALSNHVALIVDAQRNFDQRKGNGTGNGATKI
ncbi:uncharacterized protein PADG_01163 [Paracoccidioides brasiliensis Pb18]|uniref:Thioesterase domain-containing protein n=1 Tax=Paracoccidioides brasiliensis (strain Pb18) TaxID=502780 RepID=C1FZD7_PARBD|nr:uncharacterized protein PADG_01163 [Paracoccidioides brasiliensis Pb18]EEH44874.1 hypothetical protein PADG_01163 [Paracoccidioides brasiliensis Pb18]ODH49121.1 hypothetical protein GX48_04739 [Paracoccidioides brasiliensis]